jgi:phosphoribosylaminoimidazole carboxylase
MDGRAVGILGGGQLGRMLVEAANRLNIKTVILDAPRSPAKQINASSDHVNGSFSDPEAILKLAQTCDILTAEIEHIDTDILEKLETQKTVVVQPSPLTIRTIQDKYRQKLHLQKHSIATPESYPLDTNTAASVIPIAEKIGYPMMIKSRTLAYDGRGNFVVKTEADIDKALTTLGSKPLYIERWASFTKELAVMVVRSANGLVRSYPTVETVHQDNICHLVFAPADVPFKTQTKARMLAEKAVGSFQGAGVFGVEMFWFSENGKDISLMLIIDTLMINEIAPRPHNSGHYTIDACPISQYEAHLRAILDLPLPENCTDLTVPAIMLNILGTDSSSSYLETCRKALGIPGAHIHLYGKEESRKGRKMGHITITAKSMTACKQRLSQLIPTGESLEEKPEVAVIMGSDSDLPVMAAGCKILEDFGVTPQVTIVSAHRTPERMVEFAKSAVSRGIKVIIAGAGGTRFY